ncbi:MAG TPA: glutathione binding-like protein, partial [Polyangiales bacterium]|nr:glutathione binding-like protein [Polyangiales bacterium]
SSCRMRARSCSLRRSLTSSPAADRSSGTDHDYVAGSRFSMADIAALTSIDFASFIGLAIPEEGERLRHWHARVAQRPSASA